MLHINKIVTIQIPIEAEMRDALRRKAHFLGFDSIQAYIRFWAKAEVEGRKIEVDDGGWEPDLFTEPKEPGGK
jgi:hypothetical protein